MAKTDDGGAAFPAGAQTGMRLRDYFAAKAMQAMGGAYNPEAAKRAYQIADWMLQARKEQASPDAPPAS